MTLLWFARDAGLLHVGGDYLDERVSSQTVQDLDA
jgi:hypothetical protein